MAEKYRNRIMRSSGISKRKVQSEYGLRIMKMMGYKGEGGLGKNQEGRAEPIQVGRLEDLEGLGFSMNKQEIEDNWWQDTFTNALKGVKTGLNFQNQDSSDESDEGMQEEEIEDADSSDSEYDDEDEKKFKKISSKYWKAKI